MWNPQIQPQLLCMFWNQPRLCLYLPLTLTAAYHAHHSFSVWNEQRVEIKGVCICSYMEMYFAVNNFEFQLVFHEISYTSCFNLWNDIQTKNIKDIEIASVPLTTKQIDYSLPMQRKFDYKLSHAFFPFYRYPSRQECPHPIRLFTP